MTIICYNVKMRKTNIITPENASEARKYMTEISDKKIYRRLEVIALRGEGLKTVEITKITKFSRQHVSKLLTTFTQEGFKPLLTDNRGGNHRKISLLDETAFLKKYEEQALSGQIITVKEMRLDYCQTFNVSITNQGFYLILKRHNWRKVKPRSVHPKVADAEVIEASKKLKQDTTIV